MNDKIIYVNTPSKFTLQNTPLNESQLKDTTPEFITHNDFHFQYICAENESVGFVSSNSNNRNKDK